MTVLLWILVIIVLLILAVGLVLSFHFTRRATLTEIHSPKEYGLQYEPVEFKATDGLTLRGVWIPTPDSDKAVIILHGHGGSYDLDLWRVPALHEAGFNALLFDFRAHGRSEGKRMTFGYEERGDVLGAVQLLHAKGVHRIGLLGFSYGGMTAMLTAPICPEVEAVVTDGGPARILTGSTAWAAERGLPKGLTRLLARLFLGFTSVRVGANLFRYEPIRWVSKISPRPILFIHGDQDQFCADFDYLYAAAGEPKEVWRLPEAGHTAASLLYPEEHARRVIDFFNRYL